MNGVTAFLRKTFLIESSYKLLFAGNIAGIFMGLITYYFIDRLFGHRVAPHLTEFGVSYFSYILVSTALFGYIAVGLSSFPDRISEEQVDGTLESILVTPARIGTVLTGMAIWNFIIATTDLIICIIFGIFIFHVDLSGANIVSVVLVLALSVLSFTGLGIISASFVIVFKRGSPLAWLMSAVEGIAGGTFFPITVLPGWLQVVSAFLPVTYAVKAMELAVYRGYGISDLKYYLIALFVFSATLLPLSVLLFGRAIKYAKKRGTLGLY
jgi:ABC-2 type transport system permease protein